MSNPTLLVENFNGSLGAFTGVDPIRYSDGLWLEEATSNLFPNPLGVSGTGWTAGTNVTVDYAAALPAPLPDEVAAANLTTCFKCTATANIGAFGILASNVPAALTVTAHTVSFLMYIPTAVTATSIGHIPANFTGATSANGVANMSLRDQWQWVTGSITPDGGDLSGQWGVRVLSGTMNTGQVVYFAFPQIEAKDHRTSPVPMRTGGGLLITGYAFTGTANNSTSTRAASSASVTMDEPVSVACWCREAYSGAKQFAYLSPLGTLGTYGDISYAAGDLTISTTRNLVIGPFAAFDRELTAKEQSNLSSTQSWNLRTVLGGNPYTTFQLRPY